LVRKRKPEVFREKGKGGDVFVGKNLRSRRDSIRFRRRRGRGKVCSSEESKCCAGKRRSGRKNPSLKKRGPRYKIKEKESHNPKYSQGMGGGIQRELAPERKEEGNANH